MKNSRLLSLPGRRPTLTALIKNFSKLVTILFLVSGSGISTAASTQAAAQRLSQLVAVSFTTNNNATNILSSPDGIGWTRQFSGTTNKLYAITVSNTGRYVAVGDSGAVVTSTDGVNWTPRPSGVTDYLRAVTVNSHGLFVAVGSYGTIISSSDGLNWTKQRQTNSANTLFGVTVNAAGLFVAVGVNGKIVTSLDGNNWTEQFSPTRNTLNDVTVNKSTGLFVAVGTTDLINGNGFVFTSPNGVDWTLRPLATRELSSVAVNSEGLFVAGGSGGLIITSKDTIDWTPQISGTDEAIHSITVRGWGSPDQQFFASCSGGKVLSSRDAVSWTVQSTDTSDDLKGITNFD